MNTAVDHTLAVDIALTGPVAVHIVVVDIVLVAHSLHRIERQEVDYHTHHKISYRAYSVCHTYCRIRGRLLLVEVVLQEHSYFVHNGYKTQYQLALPDDKQGKVGL